MNALERNFVRLLADRFEEKSPLIQILMGPRQVGKTTGVFQFLKKFKGPYHYCSADDIFPGDRSWLLEQWQLAQSKGSGALLVVDEIQKLEGWSETVKKLWDEQQRRETRINLLLLGSSSLLLSKGMSESLAGRFELIHAHHWDFIESNRLHKMGLETYLRMGGYPKSYDYLDNYDRWFSYIKNAVIDRVIEKDILYFSPVKKPALFRQAFEILCCYPAQEISYRKLLGQLQDRGNTDLIKYYISLFGSAFLLKALPKFGSQDFKVKSSSPKILPLAICFYEVFNTRSEKTAFLFEATVGAKLLQLGGDLYYWRKLDQEVDYILSWRKKLIAVEVKSGRRRKTGGLDQFLQRYPEAAPVIISRENYEQFVSNPAGFLERLL